MWRPSTPRWHQPGRGSAPPYPLTRAGSLCLLLALAKLALLIPILGRYGWDRDELYFLAAGRHLALGYVDFPPLTAVAARLVDGTLGPSLISLRLLCSLMAVVAAVATGAVARELGASQRLQVLATAAWIVTPFGLGGAVLFHPTFLELAATALAMLAAVRLLARSEPRQWFLLGLWGGIGLESKYTIVVPLAAFLAGCALWRRDLLLRREAALGALIAIGLLLPNVIWQITHHWVSLDFASSQHAKTASDNPPLTYVAQQVAFLGAGAVLVVLGLTWMWRRHHLRPLVLACGAPSILFGLERGRPYYALPAMLPALAAGCLALAERRPRGVTLSALALAHVAVLALALPLVVPILPARQLVSTGIWDKSFWKDEIGWHELAAQTASAWRSRTPNERASGAIVAGNYGAAGALSLYGAAADLPAPVSGHLSFQYWHPTKMPQRAVMLVGFDYADAQRRCLHSTVLAVADNRWHVDNEERGRPIVWCQLRAPLGRIWGSTFATARL
jgi:4-amino-4-deoxy-L-arabinose transferase-like glycosyltransferase